MSTFHILNTDISKNDGQISLYDDVVLNGRFEGANFRKGINLKSDNLVIDGNGHTIDAKGKIPIFEISGKNIILKNINFKNGFNKEYGGAIRINKGCSCKILNCTFEKNAAKKAGDDISNGGEVFISNCKLAHTDSINNKGAVYTFKDEVEDLKPFVSNREVLTSNFNISVSVIDDDNNKPLSGAVLSIDDKTATTNENGSCSVEGVFEGINEVNVRAEGFENYLDEINVSSDNTIFSFILSRITHNVSFSIKDDENEPVEGAIITIDEKSCTTDKNGNCVIKEVNDGSNLVKVSAEGYKYTGNNVDFTSDNTNCVLSLSKISEVYPCFDKRPFQAYYGTEPYVFVSYAHADACEVFQELKRFRDFGLNIWYDEGITSGAGWQEEVENAIVNSSMFIVFISNSSISSENVREEIFLARSLPEIHFIPIYLEKTELKYGLKLKLQHVQSIYKYALPDDKYLEMLEKDLRKYGFVI
jgi:hypothetical protein